MIAEEKAAAMRIRTVIPAEQLTPERINAFEPVIELLAADIDRKSVSPNTAHQAAWNRVAIEHDRRMSATSQLVSRREARRSGSEYQGMDRLYFHRHSSYVLERMT